MDISNYVQQFIDGIKAATWYEHLAVTTGIASVWFSKKENVLVYPVGLVSTIIYIYLSFEGSLFGEATVNLYYTIMSILGWYLWMRKDTTKQETILHISYSNKKEIQFQLLFFASLFLVIFLCLTYLQKVFYPNVIPWADGFATATAFTGMYLMVKKKVESWYWWLLTNIASVPLYYYKGYVVTSTYYIVLLVMAIFGLMEWKRKVRV
jgi:nicotinamide mononucleotide transporter